MQPWHDGRLSPSQAERMVGWLAAPPVLVADLSWGLDTVVLRVRAGQRDYIVKAGSQQNRHIEREITAHERYTEALVARGAAARLVAADREANVLLLEYLNGHLVEDSDDERRADTYIQAGRLLRALHARSVREDPDHEARETARAIARLDREHRLEPAAQRAARRVLEEARPRPILVVPTHGDWQPRNWLIHRGEVRVIDFGRFEFRPPATDLCRLAVQQWRDDPSLETAFLAGYGDDPRDPELWRVELLRQAISTAVWAYQVGDDAFEAQGQRMVREALERF